MPGVRDPATRAAASLQTLSDLTTDMLDAFRANDRGPFLRLDKELETSVGRKERIVGALHQHVRDHMCAGTAAASPRTRVDWVPHSSRVFSGRVGTLITLRSEDNSTKSTSPSCLAKGARQGWGT